MGVALASAISFQDSSVGRIAEQIGNLAKIGYWSLLPDSTVMNKSSTPLKVRSNMAHSIFLEQEGTNYIKGNSSLYLSGIIGQLLWGVVDFYPACPSHIDLHLMHPNSVSVILPGRNLKLSQQFSLGIKKPIAYWAVLTGLPPPSNCFTLCSTDDASPKVHVQFWPLNVKYANKWETVQLRANNIMRGLENMINKDQL